MGKQHSDSIPSSGVLLFQHLNVFTNQEAYCSPLFKVVSGVFVRQAWLIKSLGIGDLLNLYSSTGDETESSEIRQEGVGNKSQHSNHALVFLATSPHSHTIQGPTKSCPIRTKDALIILSLRAFQGIKELCQEMGTKIKYILLIVIQSSLVPNGACNFYSYLFVQNPVIRPNPTSKESGNFR